jgi:hypothetical protein
LTPLVSMFANPGSKFKVAFTAACETGSPRIPPSPSFVYHPRCA